MLFIFAILISRMCTRVVVYDKIGGNISVLWFRSPVDCLLLFNSSNIINMKDKCLRKKFDVSTTILELFFFLFERIMGFLWWYTDARKDGRTDGRTDGRKRAYAREPCVGPWKIDSMVIPFFLSYGAPLARAFGPRGSSKKVVHYDKHPL